MKTNNNALFVLGGIVVIGLLMWLLGSQPSPENLVTSDNTNSESYLESKQINLGKDTEGDALYVCDNKKAIGVNFYENGVVLNLSDGRILTLESAESEASGGRFANKEETINFWSYPTNFVILKENGEITFNNCRVQLGEF
jgi:hypothetical protein